MTVRGESGTVILKDCTLREGLDVPGVAPGPEEKKFLLGKLAEAGIPEVELVAPGHFDRDLEFVRESGAAESGVRVTGLIYGYGDDWKDRIGRAKGVLDRVDVLIPLSDSRPPPGRTGKSRRLREALLAAIDVLGEVGAGFPHATRAEAGFLQEMCGEAAEAGAKRVTLYDTNGSADPWEVAALVEGVRAAAGIEICFHAHNDLGLATANSVAAVRAGAGCLDVTVNGLGDRAGNASLEQVALVLRAMGAEHAIKLSALRELSRAAAETTGVPVSKLAPIVGEYAFRHKSPSHLERPDLFEPFDPVLVGASRSLCGE